MNTLARILFEDAWWPVWLVVGTLIGLRASYIVAWQLTLADDPDATRCDWWRYPGPFFLVWATMVAWPIVLVALVLWPFLAAPPKEVRDRDSQKRLEEENAQLDAALEQSQRELEELKGDQTYRGTQVTSVPPR